MTGIDRRSALAAIAAAPLLGLPAPARAQITSLEIFSSSEPGGGDDQLARAIAEGLNATRLLPNAGPVSVPGDGGVRGLAEFVSGGRPRPGMLVLGLGGLGSLVLRGMDDEIERCRPLAMLIGETQPIVVAAKSPITSLGQLVEMMRRDPGGLRWAGRERGGADHQLCLMMAAAVGADARRLNYIAGDERTEVAVSLLTGEADVATADLGDLAAQIRGGTLRALALPAEERLFGFDIPTFREQGHDLVFVNWRGVLSRLSLEPDLTMRFRDALKTLVGLQGWKQLSTARCWLDIYAPQDAFAAKVASERTRLKTLFAAAGVR